jgi:hypothetical protein
LGDGKRRRADKTPPRRARLVRPKRRKAGRLPANDVSSEDAIQYSTASLHDLFQQQVRSILDRSDLDEEQKQGVLVAASCPCCGAGGMSFTVKLKPRR